LIESSRKNESALISNQRLSSQFALTTSGNPQGASEGGNNDSGDSSERSTAAIQEISSAANVQIDRGPASGIIFFGFFGCVAALIGGYALLEWWRKIALNNNKRRNKNNKSS
jgi:hypothetical protein